MKSIIAALVFAFAISVSAQSVTNTQSTDKKTQTVTKVENKNNKTTKKSKTMKNCKDGSNCCSKDKMSKDCNMDQKETPKK
jgi:hypothetical protein